MTVLDERDGTRPVDLPEPFGSLVAFLGDLQEQVEMHRSTVRPGDLADLVLIEMKQKLEAMAMLVSLAAAQR